MYRKKRADIHKRYEKAREELDKEMENEIEKLSIDQQNEVTSNSGGNQDKVTEWLSSNTSTEQRVGIENIGKDMWKQLKRVSVPTFNGDKKMYETWKSAFTACIDQAPATAEYKLLQMRQYLTGDALKCIEGLGHSKFAYEAAKERLERKFGGNRRKVLKYLDDLDNMKPIREDNPRDVEKFTDLLDVAVINLKESDRT